MSEQRKVGALNLISYGIGDLYGGGSFFIIGTLSMFFLINVAGLSPFYAALIPGLGKVWDAFSDPLMGYMTDHTHSRFGRRRIYFLIAIVPVFLTFFFIWYPVQFGSEFYTFLYYFIAYLFFYTVSTMTMVPYVALSAEMTTDFKERNRLTSTKMAFSILSTLIAGGLAMPIVNNFADPSTGYKIMGLVFAILYAAPWFFVFLGTWELPYQQKHKSDTGLNVFSNFGTIFRNKSFRIHIVMYICAYASMDMLMAWLLFYLSDVLGKPAFFSVGLPVIVIVELTVLPLYAMLSNKVGHAISLILGLLIFGTGIGLMFFHTADSSTVLLILNCALIGIGMSAAVTIPYQILPFVTDVDELMTRKNRAGTYSGAMTLIRKLIQGLIVLPVLGMLLASIGYVRLTPNQKTIDSASGQIVDAVKSLSTASDQQTTERALAKVQFNVQTINRNIVIVKDQDTENAESNGNGGFLAEKYFVLGNEKIAELEKLGKKLAKQHTSLNESEKRAETLAAIGATAAEIQKTMKIQQSSATIQHMRFLFVLSPMIMVFLGVFAALRFKLTPKTHDVLMEEIRRLKSGGSKEDVDPKTREICEQLTGYSYDKLYL